MNKTILAKIYKILTTKSFLYFTISIIFISAVWVLGNNWVKAEPPIPPGAVHYTGNCRILPMTPIIAKGEWLAIDLSGDSMISCIEGDCPTRKCEQLNPVPFFQPGSGWIRWIPCTWQGPGRGPTGTYFYYPTIAGNSLSVRLSPERNTYYTFGGADCSGAIHVKVEENPSPSPSPFLPPPPTRSPFPTPPLCCPCPIPPGPIPGGTPFPPIGSPRPSPISSPSPVWSPAMPQFSPSSPIEFKAVPDTILKGQTSTLYWSARNALWCFGSCQVGDCSEWNGSKPKEGSQVVKPSVTSTYRLMCVNFLGASHRDVTVNVRTSTSKLEEIITNVFSFLRGFLGAR